jgi:hypothetical protein
MDIQRAPHLKTRPEVVVLLAGLAMLCLMAGAEGQGSRHGSTFSVPNNSLTIQRSPQFPAYQYTAPAPAPSLSVPSDARTIQQYNPPGLNSFPGSQNAAGTQGTSGTRHDELALPPQIPPAGQGQAGMSGQGQPIQGQPPGTPPTFIPSGYQGQPPLGYAAQPPYARQFTCRTANYYCAVPYTGSCECENDRHLRERGVTID